MDQSVNDVSGNNNHVSETVVDIVQGKELIFGLEKCIELSGFGLTGVNGQFLCREIWRLCRHLLKSGFPNIPGTVTL
jgi:hypothetical protein